MPDAMNASIHPVLWQLPSRNCRIPARQRAMLKKAQNSHAALGNNVPERAGIDKTDLGGNCGESVSLGNFLWKILEKPDENFSRRGFARIFADSLFLEIPDSRAKETGTAPVPMQFPEIALQKSASIRVIRGKEVNRDFLP